MNLKKCIAAICRSVVRQPVLWFVLALIPTLPSLYGVQKIGLDSDVARLLPDHSPAAMWTKKLGKTIGDGGYFTILIKAEDRRQLLKAVESTVARVKNLAEVETVTYTHPKDFIDTYRYILISSHYLEIILDQVLAIKAELSPFTTDLLTEKTEKAAPGAKKKEQEEVKRLFDQYSQLTEYQQSADGKIIGIFIRPKAGFTKLKNLHSLFSKLEQISADTSTKFGVWAGVGGSQIDNLREYDVIITDLNRSGWITITAILLILIVSFRSVVVLPVLLYPLLTGLLWAYALIPPILGDLNIITSFLILVLFGLGIEYSIHLVKRFQQELALVGPEAALIETYCSTGISVTASALTTGLGLLVLAFSDFKGFSEFGLIGGGTILITLLAMFTVMPPTLILAQRWGMIRPDGSHHEKKARRFTRFSLLIALLLPLCFLGIAFNLRFDFDFNALKPKIPGDEVFNAYNKEVYKTRYLSPGAVILVPDLQSLDSLLAELNRRMSMPDTYFLKTTSIRDFAPSDQEGARRLDLIKEIQGQLAGNWLKKIEDPLIKRWAMDFRDWLPPAKLPGIADLPESIVTSMTAGSDPRLYVVGLYPNVSRGNGKNAMAFSREIEGLTLPASVQGPVGEMPVFAGILNTVTAEGVRFPVLSFLCVFLLLFFGFRSVGETALTTLPLLSGLVLTLGIMAAVSFKFNFFNVVILPALIGMGVDTGVHFYQRWKELAGDTDMCRRELFTPLTLCSVTNMMGYAGLIFISHPGLRSIGILACLGLGCIWLTSVILFPAVLDFLQARQKKRGEF